MKRAVLYDFHGTLVNVESAWHFLEERDFNGFYAASVGCPPNEGVILAARQSHNAGYANLLFTGMTVDYEIPLREWLAQYELTMDLILMRPVGDYRKDFALKREMYLEAVSQGYRVLRAWEDNPQCAELLSIQGVSVTRVPGWKSITAASS